MTAAKRPPEAYQAEIDDLRVRLEEAEETLRAIGNGAVDAFVVTGPDGAQIFTLKGAEQPYRVLVETMNEGAATLADDGTILYCNNRLAALLQVPLERLMGAQFALYVAPADRSLFAARLEKCPPECDKDEIVMITGSGNTLPVLVSCCALELTGSQGMSVVVTDLSQQKRNEETMASERLARSIIEQAGEAIIVCDAEGTVIRASWLAGQLCGQNPLLKPFDEMYQLTDSGTGRLFSVLSLLDEVAFKNLEVVFKRSDAAAQKFTLLLNATQLRNAEGRTFGCVITLTDITERRQSEEELRAAYEKISDILERMSDGFASFDHDWRYSQVNSAAARAFHMTPDQLLGKTIWELWPAAYDLPIGVNFRRAVQENIPIQFETYYPAPIDRWFECRCYPTLDGLATFFNDITDRKHAEEALRESEQAFRSIFEQSLDAVFLTVPNGKVVDANPAACRIFGMTVQELRQVGRGALGQNNGLAAALEESSRTALTSKEMTCVRKNGEAFPAEVSSVIVPGEPPRSFVMVRDITERKRAEEALRKAHDELEQRVATRTRELALSVKLLQDEVVERVRAEKSLGVETAERLLALEALREKEQMLIQQSRLAAMGEMIGNIAHQWRQPLNVLGLTVQQLLMYYDLGQFDRKLLAENVDTSMKLILHMSNTIDDFRNFFKPDKEKVDFKAKEAITSTLALLEGTLQTPPISVEMVVRNDTVINGYANEFAQVVLNLVLNAKDALIEREINDAKLTITVSSEMGCAVVTVADNAGGVPEEIIDKIFEPYFTTKGAQGGTGVGLFMSKTIIEKNMGGRISVRNKENGAEFRIEMCSREEPEA